MRIKEFLKQYPLLIVFAALLVAVWVVYGFYKFFYDKNNDQSQMAFEELSSSAFTKNADSTDTKEDKNTSESVSANVEGDTEILSEEELRAIKYAAWLERLENFYAVSGDKAYYSQFVDSVPDFNVLYEANDEIVAYLLIPDTVISYPVLQNEDNGFYLNHNLDKKKGYTGCLYIETFNNPDMRDPIAVIYGHDMLNDTMFGTLNKYLDAGYRKANKYFFIYTPDEIQIYEVAITSVVEDVHLYMITDNFTPKDENTMVFKGFSGDEPVKLYEAFKNKKISHSNTYMTDIPFASEDQLMVMSTCFREGTRFIVVGRRVV